MKKNIFLLFISILFSLSVKAQWEWTNGPYGGEVQAMTTCSGRIFASTVGAGVFLSLDSGDVWTPSNSGLPSYYYTTHLSSNSGTVFAGGNYGLYRSDDFGASWQQVSSITVSALLVVNDSIYVGATNGISFSNDNGINWTSITTPSISIKYFGLLGNELFVGSLSSGLYKLNIDSGVWHNFFNISGQIYGLIVNANHIIVSSDAATYISEDSGQTWILTGPTYSGPLFSFGGKYFTTDGLVLLMLDPLTYTWQVRGNTAMPQIISFTSVGNRMVFGQRFYEGIFVSLDSGSTWHVSNIGLSNVKVIHKIISDGQYILSDDCPDLTISYDDGTTWNKIAYNCSGPAVAAIRDSLILAVVNGSLSLSIDTGKTWSYIDSGLPQTHSIVIDGNNFLAGTSQGLFLSTDSGQTWFARNVGMTNMKIEHIAVSGQNIYVGTTVNPGGYLGGIYFSPDYGLSWSGSILGLPPNSILNKLITLDSVVFAAINDEGIYRSVDNGLNWNLMTNWPSNMSVSIAVSGSNIFASSMFHGVYLSQDTGQSWISIQQGMIRGPNDLEVSSTHLYATAWEASIWKRSLSDILLSANELKESTSILLFPNPAKNKLCISLSNQATQKSRIEIANLAGSIVYSAEAELSNSSCSKEIDISQFANGFYILTVADKDGKGVVREKFVVQH